MYLHLSIHNNEADSALLTAGKIPDIIVSHLPCEKMKVSLKSHIVISA